MSTTSETANETLSHSDNAFLRAAVDQNNYKNATAALMCLMHEDEYAVYNPIFTMLNEAIRTCNKNETISLYCHLSSDVHTDLNDYTSFNTFLMTKQPSDAASDGSKDAM